MKRNDISPFSPQLKNLVEQVTGVAVSVRQKDYDALVNKAQNNPKILHVLEQVFCRGMLASGTQRHISPEQYAFGRVNSFLANGKAAIMDADLYKQVSAPNLTEDQTRIATLLAAENTRKTPNVADRYIASQINEKHKYQNTISTIKRVVTGKTPTITEQRKVKFRAKK